MSDRNYFLIQVSGRESKHKSDAETWAEEPLDYNFYRNNSWHKGEGGSRDFKKIDEGDIAIFYWTGSVDRCPKQIRHIYEVEEVIEKRPSGEIGKPNQLELKLEKKLNRGLKFSKIRTWVDEGKFSKSMDKAGTYGFNLTQVKESDYQEIINWNENQEPEYEGFDLLEEHLREYLAEKGLQGIDKAFSSFELYADDEGKKGELYKVPVGEIDLLYNNESGDFLVIELKKTEATSDKVVGQLGRYVGWVREHLAENGSVKGIIVCKNPSKRLKYAVKSMKNCELYTFSLRFNFESFS